MAENDVSIQARLSGSFEQWGQLGIPAVSTNLLTYSGPAWAKVRRVLDSRVHMTRVQTLRHRQRNRRTIKMTSCDCVAFEFSIYEFNAHFARLPSARDTADFANLCRKIPHIRNLRGSDPNLGVYVWNVGCDRRITVNGRGNVTNAHARAFVRLMQQKIG